MPPQGHILKQLAIGAAWLAVLFLLAGLLTPHLLKAQKKSPSTQALTNARQIGLALFEFENDYDTFPDATTIVALKEGTGSDWNLRDATSNDLFKQLIVAGICRSEEYFYARTSGTRKPDNVISSEAKALAPGECAFAYIPGGSRKKNVRRPVVVAPLIPGTLTADPGPFEGKAVVLRVDGSVATYGIGADGRIMADGKDIFDPAQEYWEGMPPVVKWPALRDPAPSTEKK